MKIEIRLRIEAADGGSCDEEILLLDKPHDQLEMVGLSLAEARELLARVQERVVGAQAAAFVADHRHCDACGRRLWSKGRTSFQFRTPFGDVPVKGLAHHDEEEAQAAERELKRIKGYLWNGNHRDALTCIDGLVDDLEGLPTAYASIKAFRKGVAELRIYVRRNAHTIPSRNR